MGTFYVNAIQTIVVVQYLDAKCDLMSSCNSLAQSATGASYEVCPLLPSK